MALDIKPVEGMACLKLIGDSDGDEKQDEADARSPSGQSDEEYRDAVYAIVVAIGPKGPSGVKQGDTVICRAWVRDGLYIDDDTVLTESYCISGVIK